MSLQDAKRFVEETAADRKLLEQVKAVGIEAEEAGAAFFAHAAKGFGYDFTAEELGEAMRARQEAGFELVDRAELSEEELDSIAGGWCWFDNKCSVVINFDLKIDPDLCMNMVYCNYANVPK